MLVAWFTPCPSNYWGVLGGGEKREIGHKNILGIITYLKWVMVGPTVGNQIKTSESNYRLWKADARSSSSSSGSSAHVWWVKTVDVKTWSGCRCLDWTRHYSANTVQNDGHRSDVNLDLGPYSEDRDNQRNDSCSAVSLYICVEREHVDWGFGVFFALNSGWLTLRDCGVMSEQCDNLSPRDLQKNKVGVCF